MWICGEISGGGSCDFAAISVDAIEGREGAVIRALGLRAAAQVGAELRFFLLDQCLRDSGFSAIVVASEILPEFLVDAADAQEFPIGVGEFFDEDSLVGVGGLMGFGEAAAEFAEIAGAFAGEQVAFRGRRS